MKRTALLTLLFFTILTSYVSAQTGTVCRLGFTYDISRSNNWGKEKPVVRNVIPYSSAELAGIKANDIIEAIDNIPLSEIGLDEVPQLLNPAGKSTVTLTIRNLSTPSKQVTVSKECKKANTITEDQLAVAFGMYSLESTTEQDFICPFRTIVADTVDYGNFKTFSFASPDSTSSELDAVINKFIAKELTDRGLRQNNYQSDILVQTFYLYDKNPNYKGTNLVQVERTPIYRYDFTLSKMVKLPFYPHTTAEAEAPYILQFGIRLIDQRNIPGRVLWECEAHELMERSFKLEDYARIHVPLMCMQYPYVKYGRNVPFRMSKKIYNYTGISYDIDHLDQVADVDRNSPAHTAGIRAKDVVERIGRHKMNHTAEEFSAAYKKFITATMKYRDPKTTYTDVNGFSHCMFWDTFKYPMIAETFNNSDYLPAFSYLYYFAPYVNLSGNNACTFTIKRGKQKIETVVRPSIRAEQTVEIL